MRPGVRDRRGCSSTLEQIALASLLAQRPWIVPIPATRRLERLEENLAAAEIALTPDVLTEIDDAAARTTVEGHRHPEAMQRYIDR
ncbi:aldo/keto reductase [Pseudonocardia broussonetiae]|uniref:NADP-dependent oxidoreductase domain-containing protein n=1 Tax=Pseudonocardia broussonetiae TaxID=2736640 RepID=A0A6M6JRL7_9PSEU|nr:aldo/keto reductase [Pseudonocardia broussonetiae]QJY49059.1 hypothetical protein HOP40_27520 [Pseudonocardia broussonetiae]